MMGNLHGTAGAPILELIVKNSLGNVLIIVTRYFGGILLGTGGLVRAYTSVAKKGIEEANIILKKQGRQARVFVEYEEVEKFKYYCRKHEINIKKEEYSDKVIFFIEMTIEGFEKMKIEIDNLRLKIIKIDKMEEKYI